MGDVAVAVGWKKPFQCEGMKPGSEEWGGLQLDPKWKNKLQKGQGNSRRPGMVFLWIEFNGFG